MRFYYVLDIFSIKKNSELLNQEAASVLVGDIRLLDCPFAFSDDFQCLIIDGFERNPSILKLFESAHNQGFNGQMFLLDSFHDGRYAALLSEVALSLGLDLYVIRVDGNFREALEVISNKRVSFSSDSTSGCTLTNALELEIKTAIERHEITPFFQGQFHTKSTTLYGFEALARLQLNDEIIPPYLLFPIIEKHDLWHCLTESIIKKVFSSYTELNSNFPGVQLAINLSGSEIVHPELILLITEWLDSYNVPASNIMFEVTETEMLTTRSGVFRNLAYLASMGFKLSIDDYGTGHSNVTRLLSAPFDELKIDKSFVAELLQNDISRSVIESSLSVAQNLNMGVIAEGVENLGALSVLQELQCSGVQGFYLHKPESLDSVLANKSLIRNA